VYHEIEKLYLLYFTQFIYFINTGDHSNLPVHYDVIMI